MNNREMIHSLIDKLLDIEEGSKKGIGFSYSTLNGLDFHFKVRPYSSDWLGSIHHVFTGDHQQKYLKEALERIEKIKNTPDFEPKISFHLTREDAIRLGLLGKNETI